MAEQADVIIIGARIMGSATVYHLARRKYGRVIVRERDGICSGSTALASGGVRHQYAHRVGALADAPLMRAWAGLYEMTPDQMGIISAVPGMAGLHVVAGFSGHGFMHGPIAGQLMAELIADGRARGDDVRLGYSDLKGASPMRECLGKGGIITRPAGCS